MAYTKVEIDSLIKNKNTNYKHSFPKLTFLSVSNCLRHIKEEFDAETQAKRCSERDADNPDGAYYNMVPEEIIEAWNKKTDESKYYGSQLDDYVGYTLALNENEKIKYKEKHDLDALLKDERFKNNTLGFTQFYNDIQTLGYNYLTREISVYIPIDNNTQACMRGRFDCLFYNPTTDRYLLIDWKTTEKISKSGFNHKKMLGPAECLDDCNMNEYGLQLYLYKKAFCEFYKFTTPDKIDTYICQVLRSPGENGKNYILHRPLFEYDPMLINKIQEYGVFMEKRNPIKYAYKHKY